MFLGKISIVKLGSYVDGYRAALLTYQLEEGDNIFDDVKFGNYVAEYYNRPAEAGWSNNIWAESYGNEPQGFINFLRLFDEFIGDVKEDSLYSNLTLLYTGQLKQEEIKFD